MITRRISLTFLAEQPHPCSGEPLHRPTQAYFRCAQQPPLIRPNHREPSSNGAIFSTSPNRTPTTTKSGKERKYCCHHVNPATNQTCYKVFKRKADLQRHEVCVHNIGHLQKLSCPFNRCSRKGDNGFKRKDHLTEHLRHYHAKDIPKRLRRASNGQSQQAGEPEDELDE